MTTLERPHGPYETKAAALADLAATVPTEGLRDLAAGRARLLMLRRTLTSLSVQAGAFDLFILARFGHWEPDAVMVVRGLVERAHAAGQRATVPSCQPISATSTSATDPAEFVHWARHEVPLGDPAQCGAEAGRATRIACAVTCPVCIAWMHDESWTGHGGTGAR